MRSLLALSAALVLVGFGAAQAASVTTVSTPGPAQTVGERLAANSDVATSAQRKAKRKKVVKRKATRRSRSNASSPSQKGTGGREPGTGAPPVNRN